MKQLVLQFFNPPIFFLLVVLGVVLQTSLFNAYPLIYLQPDLVLICVVWCALQRTFFEGGVLVLLFSQIAEIHSSAPQGMFMCGYMAVFLIVRVLARLLVLGRLATWIQLVLFASVFWKLLSLFFVSLMGLAANQWKHTLVLLMPGAVMDGIVSIWLFRFLYRFDRSTYKAPVTQSVFDPTEEEAL